MNKSSNEYFYNPLFKIMVEFGNLIARIGFKGLRCQYFGSFDENEA